MAIRLFLILLGATLLYQTTILAQTQVTVDREAKIYGHIGDQFSLIRMTMIGEKLHVLGPADKEGWVKIRLVDWDKFVDAYVPAEAVIPTGAIKSPEPAVETSATGRPRTLRIGFHMSTVNTDPSDRQINASNNTPALVMLGEQGTAASALASLTLLASSRWALTGTVGLRNETEKSILQSHSFPTDRAVTVTHNLFVLGFGTRFYTGEKIPIWLGVGIDFAQSLSSEIDYSGQPSPIIVEDVPPQTSGVFQIGYDWWFAKSFALSMEIQARVSLNQAPLRSQAGGGIGILWSL